MASTPFSVNGRTTRLVSPEEGQRLLVAQLLTTVDTTGDVAAEQTWQQHALTLLKHSQKLMDDLGLVQVVKLQQMCAEMVLKIRLAAKKHGGEDQADQLAEYEQMLEEIFSYQLPDLESPQD